MTQTDEPIKMSDLSLPPVDTAQPGVLKMSDVVAQPAEVAKPVTMSQVVQEPPKTVETPSVRNIGSAYSQAMTASTNDKQAEADKAVADAQAASASQETERRQRATSAIGVDNSTISKFDKRRQDFQDYSKKISELYTHTYGSDYNPDHPMVKAAAEKMLSLDTANELPSDVTPEMEHKYNRMQDEMTDKGRPQPAWAKRLADVGLDSPAAEDTLYHAVREPTREALKTTAGAPSLITSSLKGALNLLKGTPIFNPLDGFSNADQKIDDQSIDKVREWIGAVESSMNKKLDKILPASIPEMQGRQTLLTKTSGIVAAAPSALAASALNPFLAATLFTLSTGSNTYDAVKAQELANQKYLGMPRTPENIALAEHKAQFAQVITTPVSMMLNMANPLTKALGTRTPFADGLINQIYRGLLVNGVVGAVDRSFQQLANYMPGISVKQINGANLRQSFIGGDGSVLEGALMSAGSGAMLGPFTHMPDVDRNVAYRNLQNELNGGTVGTDVPLGKGKLQLGLDQMGIRIPRTTMDVFEPLMQAQGTVTGKTPEQWNADVYKEIRDGGLADNISKIAPPPVGVDRGEFIKSQAKKITDLGDLFHLDPDLQKYKVISDVSFRNIPEFNRDNVMDKLKTWADDTGVPYKNDQDLFAFGMMHYTNMGRAPTQELVAPFEDAAKVMKSWIGGIKALGTKTDFPMHVEQAFDELFHMDDPLTVKGRSDLESARTVTDNVVKQLTDTKKLLKAEQASQTPDASKIAALEQAVESHTQNLKAARAVSTLTEKQFAEAKTRRIIDFTDRNDASMRLHGLDNKLDKLLAQQDSKQTLTQSNLWRVAKGVAGETGRWIMDQSHRLTGIGKEAVIQPMMEVAAARDKVEAISSRPIKIVSEDMARRVPIRGKKQTWQEFFETPDKETGTMRSTRFLDDVWKDYGHGVPDTTESKYFKDNHDFIAKYAMAEAMDNGALRRLPSGDQIKQNLDFHSRALRQFTEDGFRVLMEGGTEFENLKKQVIKNEGYQPGTPQYEGVLGDLADMQDNVRQGSLSTSGMLERSRYIKKFPDFTTDASDNIVMMLHTNPVTRLRTMAHKAGVRIGIIQNFGQGILQDVSKGDNFAHTSKKLLEIFDEYQDRESEGFKNQTLLDAGAKYEDIKKLTPEQRDLAVKSLGVSTTNDIDAIREQALSLTSGDLQRLIARRVDQIKSSEHPLGDEVRINKEIAAARRKPVEDLVKLAQELGGVDTTRGMDHLLSGIKQRLQGSTQDLVMKKIEDLLSKTGDLQAFQSMMRKLQGIPEASGLGSIGVGERGLFNVVTKGTSDILNSALISNSAAPNLLQTFNLASKLGYMKTGKAIVQAIFGDHNQLQIQEDLGAVKASLNYTQLESRNMFRKAGFHIRQAIQKGAALDFLNDFNELVTAIGTDNMIKDIKKNGMGEDHRQVLKLIGMTDREMTQIKTGQISTQLATRLKIQMVRASQFTGTESFTRADILNYPVLKLALPLMSYTTETLKTGYRLGEEFISSAKALKDPTPQNFKRFSIATQKGLAHLAVAGGTAMVAGMIQQAMKGSPPRYEDLQKDSYWDEFRGALAQASVFGPLGRIVDNYDYSAGSIERYAFMFSPSMSAAMRSFSILSGMFNSSWQNEPFYRRMKEAVSENTPLYKALRQKSEYTMYPQAYDYDDIKARVQSWKRIQETLEGKESVRAQTAPINPDYEPFFQALRRGDYEGLTKLVPAYYQSQADKGVPPALAAEALQGSLTPRAPIPFADNPKLGEFNRTKFLSSLPEDAQRQAYGRDQEYRDIVRQITGF